VRSTRSAAAASRVPLDDVAGGLAGGCLAELIARPIHWLLWGTGVLAATLLSFGRFQIEPFGADEDGIPEQEGPVLSTIGATVIGAGIWLILIAALVWEQVI
jgi:hypothetical protein